MLYSTRPSKQARDILSDVHRHIRIERECPQTVLTEDDWMAWMNEDERIKGELKEIASSQSNTGSGLWNWMWSSPKETRALEDAQALLTCVQDTIDQRSRERIMRKSIPDASSPPREGMALSPSNLSIRHPDRGVEATDAVPNKPSPIVTSPSNMQYQYGNVPSVITPSPSCRDYTSAVADAIDAPLAPNDGRYNPFGNCEPLGDSDLTATSVTQRSTQFHAAPSSAPSISPLHSPSPPSPPHTGSHGTRRPPPPPPPPRQTSKQRRVRASGNSQAINCIDITGGIAEGLTLNYGGSGNSGAVIHRELRPYPPNFQSQVPHF